jgi:hypothetical protein
VPIAGNCTADASISPAERFLTGEVTMRHQRKTETPEERSLRLVREAQMKKDEAAANEAAIDRLIRQNIAQFGP